MIPRAEAHCAYDAAMSMVSAERTTGCYRRYARALYNSSQRHLLPRRHSGCSTRWRPISNQPTGSDWLCPDGTTLRQWLTSTTAPPDGIPHDSVTAGLCIHVYQACQLQPIRRHPDDAVAGPRPQHRPAGRRRGRARRPLDGRLPRGDGRLPAVGGGHPGARPTVRRRAGPRPRGGRPVPGSGSAAVPHRGRWPR